MERTRFAVGGWVDDDFAPEDSEFRGDSYFDVQLPSKFTLPVNKATKRLYYGKFSEGGRYPNVDNGTTIELAWPEGASAAWIPTINKALDGYPIPLIKCAKGAVFDRGMHVMVEIKTGWWVFRRLNDQLQRLWPSFTEWLAIPYNENAAPKRPAPTSVFDKQARRRIEPADAPAAAAAEQVVAAPAAAAAQQVVSAPASAPAAASAAQQVVAAPVERLNGCETLLLRWMVADCSPEGEEGQLVAVPFDDVCRWAAAAIGRDLLTPGLQDRLLQSFERRGCMVSTTSTGLRFLNGRGLRLGSVGRIRTMQPLDFTRNKTAADARRRLGERLFRSRVELEHFLFLSYFFTTVHYESGSANFHVGNRTVSYTPDFFLPDVGSLEAGGPSQGGVLIESKAAFPSRDEIRSCLQVVEQGRTIVVLYGYANQPVSERRTRESADGEYVPGEWRSTGIQAVLFTLVDGRAQIKCRDALWCMDGNRPVLREWLDVDDYATDHPKLLAVYEDIASVPRL
jgi:hypothetical protein